MRLIQHVPAPQALIELITTHYETITTIETVILVGGTPLLQGKMGVFVPETGSVIIDMKACMADQKWMQQGMSYVANVWCNLIYTVFHEGAHAQQMLDQEIIFDEQTWDAQVEILDHAADVEAMEKMVDWFEIHPGIPPLEQLGWVGQQIQDLFKNVYHKAPDLINTEIELLGTEAGGLAIGAALNPALEGDIEGLNLSQDYKNASEGARLLEAVDRGDIGLKVNGKKCLRTGDFIEVIIGRNRS